MKKPAQWVAPSFDSFDDFMDSGSQKAVKTKQAKLSNTSFAGSFPSATSRTQPCRSLGSGGAKGHLGRSVQKRTVVSAEALWSEKYCPQTKADLAVHPKKVGEVEMWFQNYQKKAGRACPLLLLTGPAGCGKTATLKVLAREMGLDIQEWINPTNSGRSREDWTVDSFTGKKLSDSESQVKVFQDFLLRANKYQTLQIFGGSSSSGKVVIIEDFPNFFFKDPQSFHDVLRKYKQQGKCPLVFVVSDSASGQSNERLLFPPSIQAELNISNISFNPVAMTLLTKLLTRIANSEDSQPGKSNTFTKPTATVVESIAMSCAGDIRGAVNALQFASLKGKGEIVKGQVKVTKGTVKKGQTQRGKGLSKSKTDSGCGEGKEGALGFRDSSLFLFRALGRVLYAKRDPEDSTQSLTLLPSHLSHHNRTPLQVNAEDVIDRCHISGDFFNAYLHQNYLEFFSTIEDVERASEYFSIADFLTSQWAAKRLMDAYASSVAVRGLMHSNCAGPPSGSGRGWKPLHKPQLYASTRKTRDTTDAGKALFQAHWCTPEVLFAETLPYISLINITLHNPRQIAFLQEICRFAEMKGLVKLDDKEGTEIQEENEDGFSCLSAPKVSMPSVVCHNEDSSDTIISNSQSTVKVPAEDEEIVIDEFDEFDD
ncbi:cell cycle checkpoint protein RAD17-like [Liolophura sinensis]|uniref:cell cycle checkpoint protein RAD17-like n=1 Tax=Liolophura sinensis TaxID=3198878 RepID=UPI003158697F